MLPNECDILFIMYFVIPSTKCQQDENPHWTSDCDKMFDTPMLFTFES